MYWILCLNINLWFVLQLGILSELQHLLTTPHWEFNSTVVYKKGPYVIVPRPLVLIASSIFLSYLNGPLLWSNIAYSWLFIKAYGLKQVLASCLLAGWFAQLVDQREQWWNCVKNRDENNWMGKVLLRKKEWKSKILIESSVPAETENLLKGISLPNLFCLQQWTPSWRETAENVIKMKSQTLK